MHACDTVCDEIFLHEKANSVINYIFVTQDRLDLFQYYLSQTTHNLSQEDLEEVADVTELFSASDINNVVDDAEEIVMLEAVRKGKMRDPRFKRHMVRTRASEFQP